MKVKISDSSTERQRMFAWFPMMTTIGPFEAGCVVWLEYVYMWYSTVDRRVEIQTKADFFKARDPKYFPGEDARDPNFFPGAKTEVNKEYKKFGEGLDP